MPYRAVNLSPTDGPIRPEGPSPSFVYDVVRQNQTEIWKNRLRLGSVIWNAGPIDANPADLAEAEPPEEFLEVVEYAGAPYSSVTGWGTDSDHQLPGVTHDISTSCLEFSTPPWQWTCIPINWPSSATPPGHKIDLKIRLGLWVREGNMRVVVGRLSDLRNLGVTFPSQDVETVFTTDEIYYQNYSGNVPTTVPSSQYVLLAPSDDFQVVELTIENFTQTATSLDKQDVDCDQLAVAFLSHVSTEEPNPSPSVVRVGMALDPNFTNTITPRALFTQQLYAQTTMALDAGDVSGSDAGWPDVDGKFHGIVRLPRLLGSRIGGTGFNLSTIDYYVLSHTRAFLESDTYNIFFLDRPIEGGLQRLYGDIAEVDPNNYRDVYKVLRLGYAKLNWIQVEEIATPYP